MRTRGFFWHIHHDLLIEYSSNITERLDYIDQNKNSDEIPLRIKLLKPAKLPAALNTIVGQYSNFSDLPLKYKRQLAALHKKQCHPRCPWKPTPGCGPLYGNLFIHWDSRNLIYWLKPAAKSKAKK